MDFFDYIKTVGKYVGEVAGAIGLGFFLSQSTGQEEISVEKDFRYAVIVGQDTYNRKDWKIPADRLVEKHDGRLFIWDEQIEEILGKLKEYQPTHVACVGRPSEMAIPDLGKTLISELDGVEKSLPGKFYALLNQLDDDPYPDAFGGIITGYTADDALRLANSRNFTINNVLGKGFEPPIYMVRNGLVFGEAKDHNVGEDKTRMVKRIRKTNSEMVTEGVETAGEEFIDFLNTGHPDFVGFGGHAGGDSIALGDGYDDVVLVCREGNVYGIMPPDKVIGKVESTNPKVYLSATNCQFARIKSKEESTALAFIHSGGAVQLFGLMSDAGLIAEGVGNYIGHGFKANLIETSENPTFFEALKMAQIGNMSAFENLNKTKVGLGIPGNQLIPEEIDKLYGHHALIGIGDPAVEVKFNRDKLYTPSATKNFYTRFNDDGTVTYRFTIDTDDQPRVLQRPPVYLLPVAIELSESLKMESSPKDLAFILGDDFVVLDVGESIDNDPSIGLRLNHNPIAPNSHFELEITAKRKNGQ